MTDDSVHNANLPMVDDGYVSMLMHESDLYFPHEAVLRAAGK